MRLLLPFVSQCGQKVVLPFIPNPGPSPQFFFTRKELISTSEIPVSREFCQDSSVLCELLLSSVVN
jgi:hypothetical protein